MKVDEYDNLTHEQKKDLFNMPLKYKANFSSKPGLCKIFEYEFEVECSEPIVGHTRQIPFSVRPAVREQIRQMMADNVLEISTSSYVNPLTIVLREEKKPRICTDARAVNRHIVPDRARVPPIQDLLQQFHGSRFITSIDLSSAFLQIGLKKECRKYTSFLFDSQLYQYTRCPYGFKNSLSAFIRVLQLTLGSDTHSYAVAYVDDIIVLSPSFELHLKHLDTVMGRLTQAGFSINAKKCKFCKTEISFLGHVRQQGSVSPDPRRIEAVLSYPAPRNQRQLRQFLGTCNYHHRFIINYADYVASFLPLLKKGSKWIWSPEYQRAFEELRARFAYSIHLVHPDETLPYIINTDASLKAIACVLMQIDRDGKTHLVSTASRVLTQTERRYTLAEKELLAIFPLEKFKLHLFGHEIQLNRDNKALSFLNKCALTSNRVTRWVMQTQDYNLHVKHISGAKHFFKDTLSRHPGGLTEREIKELSMPKGIMVSAINLDIDPSVER
jgi:hypothetical protein